MVDAVEDPFKQISLPAAKKIDQNAEIGTEIREAKPTDALGRISAQTAKQVILQKVREAERDSVFSEFQGRQGELVNCTVKRLEGSGLHRRYGQNGSAPSEKGAVARRELSAWATACAASSKASSAAAKTPA